MAAVKYYQNQSVQMASAFFFMSLFLKNKCVWQKMI